MSTFEHPMPGQIVMRVDNLGDYADETRRAVTDLAEATVVTSLVEGEHDVHRPVIDLDIPARVIPSTTPGHGHLYIDHELSWDDYERLLTVMTEVGLVEPGYLAASRDRKHTAVRLPWVRKDTERAR